MKNLYAKIALYHSKWVKLEKDKQNPYFKSMYMSLDNIVNTITPIFNEIWLVLYHTVDIDEWIKYVNSVLADPESGEKNRKLLPYLRNRPTKGRLRDFIRKEI
jgi:hypothetical protein